MIFFAGSPSPDIEDGCLASAGHWVSVLKLKRRTLSMVLEVLLLWLEY